MSDLNIKEIVRTLCKKELQKLNQKEFRIEKVKREKVINTIVHGKDTITHLIAILVKKTQYK